MTPSSGSAYALMPPATTASTGTQASCIDTLGPRSDKMHYLECLVFWATHSTSGEAVRTITFSESDTLTSPSSQSVITELSCNTTTSTSAPNACPAVTVTGLGAISVFRMDIKARKRYIGLQITPGSNTMTCGAIWIGHRLDESADSAANKSLVNQNLTTATVAQVVEA